MNWKLHVEKLSEGETVSFRPKGNSMKGRIESGDLVTVSPDLKGLAVDDAVLCKVKGCFYVHLVKAEKTDGDKTLYLIGNNRGGINGWVGRERIFGRVTEVTSE